MDDGPYSLIIRAQYEYSFKVSSEDYSHIDYLSKYYGKCVKTDGDSFDIAIDITVFEDEFKIAISSGEVITTLYPLYVIHQIIFEKALSYCQAIAFHGSALGKNGKAVLFIAPTCFGKTTLSCFLSLNGFGLISEDVVSLELNSEIIKNNMFPFHLREQGYEALRFRGYEDFGVEEIFDGKNKRYVFNPDLVRTENCQISAVFFSKYSNNNSFKALTVKDAIKLLLYNTIIPYSVDNKLLNSIIRLAQKDCYSLEYSSLEYALECVNKAIDGPLGLK